MTLDDVRARVARIEAMKADDETAHYEEDELWSDVLVAIRDGAKDASALATEALKTGDIDFARWYA